MSQLFKIRHKKTGLFSMGGSWDKWSKTGRVWKRKSDLSAHLSLVSRSNRYDDAEVVVYELVETQIGDIHQMMEGIKERRRKKAEAHQRWYKKLQEDREKAELARLQKKYGQ